jgi:hypothetical protein
MKHSGAAKEALPTGYIEVGRKGFADPIQRCLRTNSAAEAKQIMTATRTIDRRETL